MIINDSMVDFINRGLVYISIYYALGSVGEPPRNKDHYKDYHGPSRCTQRTLQSVKLVDNDISYSIRESRLENAYASNSKQSRKVMLQQMKI